MQIAKLRIEKDNVLRINRYFILMFVQKIIVACYLFPFLIMGQNIDSLKRCLKTEAIDSVRLRLQYDIGHYTPIMRITYWDSLLIDAEKINSKYYEASSLLKKGAIYMRLGNYPLVLNNEFKALKIAEQINAKPLLCQIYNVLGVAYKENDETAKAFYYINQSLKINRKLGNDNGKSKAYIVLGMIYQEQRNYDEACFYQTKALQIAEKINDNELISTCYNNLGSAYLDKKEYAKAQHYFTKAFDVNEIVGNPYLRAFLLYNIGDAYCQCNDYKNGISFLENALEAMRKNKNLSGIKLCNERLSDVYLKQEPNNKALAYYKAFVANRDSLYNEENTKKLIQAEVNYEYEKKEYLIKQEAKQQRQIILWIAFIVVLIIILCIIFYAYKQKNNKLQQERNMAVLEQKLLRTQMNPHFVFNALTALRGLIYKDDKIEAGRYLSKVATLIRTTLDNSRTEFVLLNKEIETLEDYLKINQVLVTIPFEYKITIDTQIETDAWRLCIYLRPAHTLPSRPRNPGRMELSEVPLQSR